MSADTSAQVSAKPEAPKVSAKPKGLKPKRKPKEKPAETSPDLTLNVDDATLYELIAAGKVGVHRNGSRQKKHGTAYDFRGQYRALRLNTGDRKVLAFGTPERLAGKLDELGLHVCFDHTRPVLSVGRNCRDCGADYRLAAGQRRA